MQSKIVKSNDKLLLEINGELFLPHAYMSYVRQRADYEGFKKNGCRLFFACLYMGDTFWKFEPHIWKGEGEYDFSPFKDTLEGIIGQSKIGEIYLLLRINLNAPQWWLDKYPDDVMENEQGGKWLQSPCSARWLNACEQFLSRLQAWIVENGYEEYIAGWQLAALATEEWYIPEDGNTVFDFSKTGAESFRAYCREKYTDVQALNKAWHTQYSDFSEITVPTYAERNVFSLAGQYRKLYSDCYGADYFSFCSDSVANAILRLSATAKQILAGKILVGAFYGYVLQLPASKGHAAFSKVLASKDVDFFASPFAYANLRQGAHDWFYHGAMTSAAKAGKVWFLEADVRTYLTEALPKCCPALFEGKSEEAKNRFFAPVWFGPKTEEQTKHHLTRSLGKVLASGNAFWWFDMWGGWYKTDGLMSHIKRIETIYETSMLRGDCSVAETALIYDEKMSINAYLGGFFELTYEQAGELGKLGAPYDIYLFEDFGELDFSKYKTLIFVGALQWTDKEIAVLEKLKGENRSLLFSGLTGLYTNNSERILGIAHTLCESENKIEIVTNEEVERDNAVIKKEFPAYRIAWSGTAKFTAEQVRSQLQKSGGHIYSDQEAIVYANEKYVTYTATKTGEQTIFLPKNKKGKILVNEKQGIEQGNVLILQMREDETALIELYDI